MGGYTAKGKGLPLAVCLRIAANGLGLGEGGLVGCSNLAECVCPLLPNPCYKLAGLFSTKAKSKH